MKISEVFLSPVIRVYAIVLIVNLTVLTTGMSLAWPSPMLVKLSDPSRTHLCRAVTTEEGSWIVSLGSLISFFLVVPSGYLMDLLGRKYFLMLASLPKLSGGFLTLFASEVWMITLGRTITLLGDTMVLLVVPGYTSEIASKEQRGALGTFLQLFSSLGIVTTFSVGPFISYLTFNTIFLVIIAATSLPLLFLPDSPYHQYSKGNCEQATKTLILLRGSELVAEAEIEEYAKTKNEAKIDKKALLTNKMFLKSLGIAMLVASGAQVIGYNAVQFYMQSILESSKTSVKSEIGSVIIGLIQLVASLCTVIASDRFGRRPILMSSLIGVLVGLLGLGLFFQVSQRSGYEVTGFMNYLPTASLVIIVFCFSAGIGSVSWVISAEMFEGPARALGMSIILSVTNLIIFILTKYFASLTLTIGAANTYWVFSVNCTIVLSLIFLFVPETKGKTFNEIQKILMERTFTFRQPNAEVQGFKENNQ